MRVMKVRVDAHCERGFEPGLNCRADDWTVEGGVCEVRR